MKEWLDWFIDWWVDMYLLYNVYCTEHLNKMERLQQLQQQQLSQSQDEEEEQVKPEEDKSPSDNQLRGLGMVPSKGYDLHFLGLVAPVWNKLKFNWCESEFNVKALNMTIKVKHELKADLLLNVHKVGADLKKIKICYMLHDIHSLI